MKSRLNNVLNSIPKFLLLIVMFTLFANYTPLFAIVNKTIAKVNDDVILQTDYDKVANPVVEQIKSNYSDTMTKEEIEKKITEIKKELLDQMIDQKLLLQEAKKRDLKVSKREVDNGIDTVKERFQKRDGKTLTPTEAETEFNAELKKQNLTMNQFRDKIHDDLLINKLIESDIISRVEKPTEQELKEYYEKNKDKLDDPEKVSVRHILTRVSKNASIKEKSQALNKIKEVQKKLKNSEDFAKLAEEYSEDPGSAKEGGDLGFIVKGMMVKSFEDVAFKTPVGEVSDIFETEFGYHIIKVDAKKAKQKRTYEQVKDDLEKYLRSEKNQEQYVKYMKVLRDKASISVDNVEK
ncbi:MAG: hypothetical protein A2539_04305 [Elusimicrobia bacterium RIFOXYD2_FULL_34_15]|nr:MAG: hypothetical protein A2539_04305 [Elusimicrobia bacterium RIFOXYD2_FULL_34_15]